MMILKKIAYIYHSVIQSCQSEIQSQAIFTIIIFLSYSQQTSMLKWDSYESTSQMEVIKEIYMIGLPFRYINNTFKFVVMCLLLLLQLLIFSGVIGILFLNSKSKWFNLLKFFIHYFLTLFNQILFIPSMNLAIHFSVNITTIYEPFGQIIGITLQFFSLAFMLQALYFVRTERLNDFNCLRTLPNEFFINLLQKILLILCLYFQKFDISQEARLAFLIINWLLQIIRSIQFRQLQHKFDLIFAISSITVGLTLQMEDGLMGWLLWFTIAFPLVLKLQNLYSNHIIMTETKNTYSNLKFCELTLQNQESAKEDKVSRMMVIFSQIKHQKSCMDCKSEEQIVQCILNNLLKTKMKTNPEILLYYCYYLLDSFALKGLIIILQNNKSLGFYIYGAKSDLEQQLTEKIIALQKYTENQSVSKKEQGLELLTAHKTLDSPKFLFDKFVEVLSQKIIFWQKLLNGYNNIKTLFIETLKMTNSLIKIQKQMNMRFELKSDRLRGSASSDIYTLKILQIYYSVVYNNYIKSCHYQKEIEDCLKNDIYFQNNSLNNQAIIDGRIVILRTSLVRNKGQLINIKDKLVQALFNTDLSKQSINIKQLMPRFISQVHDDMIDHFVEKGVSHLFYQGSFTFFQNFHGFIEPCFINICNTMDTKDDYILSLILQKPSYQSEYIIFSDQGEIFGITEKFFQLVLSTHIKIGDLITKALIQFYIPNIRSQIRDLQSQYKSSRDPQLINQKSVFLVPSNHQLLIAQHDQIKKSQDLIKKYVNDDQNEEQLIDGLNIFFLNEDQYSKQTNMISDIINQDNRNSVQSNFSYYILSHLSIRTLDFIKGRIPYFVLQINEFRQIENSTYNTCQSSKHDKINDQEEMNLSQVNSQNQVSISMINRVGSCDVPSEADQEELEVMETLQKNHDRYLEQLKKMNSFNEYEKSLSKDFQDQKKDKQVESSDRQIIQSYLSSIRQNRPLFQKPSNRELHDQDFDIIQNDFQQLEQSNARNLNQDDLINQIEFLNEDEQKQNQLINSDLQRKSKSNSNERNDLVQKIQQNKMNLMVDQSLQSSSSTLSTSKDAISSIREVCENYKMVKFLKIDLFIHLFVGVLIFISLIINVTQIKSTLNDQTNQIIQLKNPLNINNAYTVSMFFQWIKIEEYYGLIELSPYIKDRIDEDQQEHYQYMVSQMRNQQISIAVKADTINFQLVDVTMYDDKEQRINQKMGLVQFYSIFFERVLHLIVKDKNLNAKEVMQSKFEYLQAKSVLRANILQLYSLNRDLIQLILQETLDEQNTIEMYFFILCFCEAFIISLLLVYQIKYWLDLDQIQKKILILITRVTEEQAYEQIARITALKDILEASEDKWKNINFTVGMYDNYKNKKKTSSAYLDKKIHKQAAKGGGTLNTRIYDSRYRSFFTLILFGLLIIIFCGFFFGGYALHIKLNGSFKPTLEMTLSLVRFKLSLDSAQFLGEIIKTEHLIPGNQIDLLPQKETIEIFKTYQGEVATFSIQLLQQIVKSDDLDEYYQTRFRNLLNSNLCEEEDMIQFLPFCSPEKVKGEWNSNDNYKDMIERGIYGIVSAIDLITTTDYYFELNTLKYSNTREDTIKFLETITHRSLFLGYFLDIQYVIKQMISMFQESNLYIHFII